MTLLQSHQNPAQNKCESVLERNRQRFNSDSIFHTHKEENKKDRQFVVPIFLQNCCSDYFGSHNTVIKNKNKRDTTLNLIDEPIWQQNPIINPIFSIRLLFDLKVQL